MKTTVVLLTTLSNHPIYCNNYDYIGVDRGTLIGKQANIPLCCGIGDFDSLTYFERKQLDDYCKLICLPQEKDETDTEFAINYAIQCGYQKIIVDGVCKGRLDHTLNNLILLSKYANCLHIVDEKHDVSCFEVGTYKLLKQYQYLSFFALEPSCISLSNVKYPLQKHSIIPSDTYLISNEIVDKFACLTVHQGKVLCVQCSDI